MNSSHDTDEDIASLEALDRELRYADAEFEHQQRRYRDKLERSGSDWAFAADAKRIARNRSRIAKERAEIAEKLTNLQTTPVSS